MSCCGNKKDVPHNTHQALRPTKVYGVDNEIINVPVAGYRPIPKTNAGSYSKVTKQEDYAVQHTGGSKSRVFGNDDALNFQLDHEPGVSNTFDIPTFDYQPMLAHNIYFNLNTKEKLNIDDGNRSTLKDQNSHGQKTSNVK